MSLPPRHPPRPSKPAVPSYTETPVNGPSWLTRARWALHRLWNGEPCLEQFNWWVRQAFRDHA